MPKSLKELEEEALQELTQVTVLAGLEVWRRSYLGRQGALTAFLRRLKDVPPDDRPRIGEEANRLKDVLEKELSEKEKSLREEALSLSLERDRVDVTLPGYPFPIGHLHPLTRVLREISEIFVPLGFRVLEGPEVEWDYYNFEALNIPRDHPARDMFNTLWISPEGSDSPNPMLLRTHTSPMQIRIMESNHPPIRVIVPGKVYRYEATDATHETMFHQFEGLAVDEHITMADLKGTLYHFARLFFGEARKVRFRCDYFPFVEPGVEVAIDCFNCEGKGCSLCKGSGWLEIFGAGMVHPRVLSRVGYDTSRYTGFAFGGGLERMAMLRYGIDDIRLFYSNDRRFLKQF
ncbi:MAG: phenylalanine--tRNA ligase subunit alpha [Chloroflexi bacterium]|nr:phenylalanine--tRNA ligase subunit alpha [Chloroflexota bacterium]